MLIGKMQLHVGLPTLEVGQDEFGWMMSAVQGQRRTSLSAQIEVAGDLIIVLIVKMQV